MADVIRQPALDRCEPVMMSRILFHGLGINVELLRRDKVFLIYLNTHLIKQNDFGRFTFFLYLCNMNVTRCIISFLLFLVGTCAFAQGEYIQCEDTCRHIHGIDISHYQGTVFWETVGQNSHMAYVYIKCSEGSERIDERYANNIELAHRYGLKVGSYHFFRPRMNLRHQLENFKAQCRPGDQDLIPMIDIETNSNMSTTAFCDSVQKFLLMVSEAYHQKPLVYTYQNFYNKYLQGKVDGYPLFIAKYTEPAPVLADGRDYILWQYTGKGRLNGFNTYVDKSRLMGRHSLREIRFKHW